MNRRLACLLPVLLTLGCKPKPPQIPDDDDGRGATSTQYSDAAYATNIQPIRVCEHLARMVAADAGVLDPQIDPSTMATCDKELSIEAAMRGTANWNDIAGCVLQAQTDDDLGDCEQRYPMAADTEREALVCDHMLEVVMHEAAAQHGGELPPLEPQERLELREECIGSFLTEQRSNLDPNTYEELLTCLANATAGAQMEAC